MIDIEMMWFFPKEGRNANQNINDTHLDDALCLFLGPVSQHLKCLRGLARLVAMRWYFS